MSAALARVVADIPRPLHKRVKDVSQRHRATISELIRHGLELRLDQITAKERELEQERAAKPKRALSVVGGGSGGVTPLDQRPHLDLTPVDQVDRLAPIFEKHAARLMQVVGTPDFEACRQQAFAAIKNYAPLTYGSDDKIKDRLEALIFEKAALDEQANAAANTASQPQLQHQPLPVVATTAANTESALASLAKLAELIRRPAPPPVDDPLVGKSLDTSRVRSRVVIQDDDSDQ